MSLQKRGASKKPFGILKEKIPGDGQGRTQSIATKIKIKAPGVIFFHVTAFRAQLKRAYIPSTLAVAPLIIPQS